MKTLITVLAMGAALIASPALFADSATVPLASTVNPGDPAPVHHPYRLLAEDLREAGFDDRLRDRSAATVAALLNDGRSGVSVELAREQARTIREEVARPWSPRRDVAAVVTQR